MQTNLFFSLFLLFFTNCGDHESSGTNPPTNSAIAVTLDPLTTFQTIAGFGGASGIFNGIYPSASDAARAFGTDQNDLGMSIFRIKVPYDPNHWPAIVAPAQEAMNYHVKIIASPWSPPPTLKSNGDPVSGRLLPDNYDEYVTHLNDYLSFMTANGVDIYAISIQNEPDVEVTYESCDWNESEILNFIRDFGDQINTRVMASESFNFTRSYTNQILGDADAVNNFDIVAGHIYGGGLATYPLAEQQGKEIWMTEYLMNLNTGNAGSPAWTTYTEEEIWDETLGMLNTIHQAMSFNWNAYVWWYLKRYYSFLGDGTQGTTSGEILPRGVAFSHFSKFVKPGYQRIDFDEEQDTGLDITAYRGNNQMVIVAINANNSGVPDIALSVAGSSISSATSYVSSASLSRNMETWEVVDNEVVVSFTRRSVTTIVLEL